MKTILDVIKELRCEDPPLVQLGLDEPVTFGKFLEFEVVKWNGRTTSVPTEAINLPGKPNERSYQYRGQVQRYSPCETSALRGVELDEWQIKAHLTLERFRIAELELFMRNHPFNAVAKKYGYSVDYHGLAQHYGIPTSLLDLTSNIEIAAFFAVANWDKHNKSFTPAEKGKGVMYRLNWIEFGAGYSKHFEPVGFGPGLRPARQHAFTLRLPPTFDFETIDHLTTIEFEHSKSASQTLFDMFTNGDWLYPPDCLADQVERLRNLPFVTAGAIRFAAHQDGEDTNQIEKIIDRTADFLNSKLGIEVIDGYSLELENDDLLLALKQAGTLEEAILKLRTGFRLASSRP